MVATKKKTTGKTNTRNKRKSSSKTMVTKKSSNTSLRSNKSVTKNYNIVSSNNNSQEIDNVISNTVSPASSVASKRSTASNNTSNSNFTPEENTSNVALHNKPKSPNNKTFENNNNTVPDNNVSPTKNRTPSTCQSVPYVSPPSPKKNTRGTKRKRQQEHIDWDEGDIPPIPVLINQMDPQHPDRLFYKILMSNQTNNILQCWLADYRLNKENALREIYQLFVDVASFQHIDVNIFLDVEYHDLNDIVKYMTSTNNLVTMATQRYFLLIRNKKFEKKHKKIESFIETFVEKCAREKIIYDFHLFKKIISFIVLFCKSELRSIRHTGVYLGLKFQTGLVKVESLIVRKVYKLQQLIEKETDVETIEQIKSKIGKLKNYDDEVNKMISNLQLHVFSTNWHLMDPKLGIMRIECIEELYKWIQIFPGRYLHNHTLSYFIKAMDTDFDKKVRYKALEIIGQLVENYQEILENKMLKLLDPVVLRIRDKVVKIASLAVATINKIRKYIKLPSSIREILCRYIFAPRYTVAAACGKYLVEVMIEKNKNDGDEGLVILLMKFEEKCNQNKIKNYHYYLIDSLYDFLPICTNIKPFINVYNCYDMDEEQITIWAKLTAELMRITFFGKCSLRREIESRKPRIVSRSLADEMFKDMLLFIKDINNNDIAKLMLPILQQLQAYKNLNPNISSIIRNICDPK